MLDVDKVDAVVVGFPGGELGDGEEGVVWEAQGDDGLDFVAEDADAGSGVMGRCGRAVVVEVLGVHFEVDGDVEGW